MSSHGHAYFVPHPTDNCFECYQQQQQQQQQQNILYPTTYCNLNGPGDRSHLSTPYSASDSGAIPPLPPAVSMSYSTAQLEVISTSLFQARDGERLVSLFSQIGVPDSKNEQIFVAYIYALYHANEFERLFSILSTHHFSPQHFDDLQEIWHNARYKESQLKRGKMLNPVEKYRLRRKFPPPKTIWDGEETVYSFKENSRKYLKQTYKQNPYPTQEQKKEISKVTGLKIVQISNWFKNRRQRDKPQSKGSPESSSSSMGSSEFQLLSPHSFNVAAAAAYSSLPLNVGMFYETS